MSRVRLVITAVVVEGPPVAEVAATYNVARSWVHDLVARHRTEGDAAFEPRSRPPHTSPRRCHADKEFGLESVCVGGGQGMAMIIQRLS